MLVFKKFHKSDKSGLLKFIQIISDEVAPQDKNLANQKSWNWRYNVLPTGKSYIYLAKKNNIIIGYYHIPTYSAIIENKKMTIGNIQSVAIHKDYRYQKIFQKLANYANHDINQYVDLIYTFPNYKSIRTFTNYNNFQIIDSLPIYVRPIAIKGFLKKQLKIKFFGFLVGSLIEFLFDLIRKRLNENDIIEKLNDFDNDVETLFHNLVLKHDIGLIRDKNYLNWRYNNSLSKNYKIIGLRNKSKLLAVVIVKYEYIFSQKCLIIMDIAYDNENSANKLLNNLDKLFVKEKFSFLIKSGISIEKKVDRPFGFIKIPNFLNPRKLFLLARWTNPIMRNKSLKGSNWLVTLGDWDVF